MDKQQLSQLFERYLRNQCTEAEIKTLLHHVGEQENGPVLKELMMKALQAEVAEHFVQQEDVKEALQKADTYLANMVKERNTFTKVGRYLRYGMAAAVVLACSIGIYLYRQSAVLPDGQQIQLVDADPGTEKAVLTLADGHKIVLDGKEAETILEDEGMAITKTADGRLIYSSIAPQYAANGYNEITTPRGGQYQIILPDGSKVWLNAASTLKYPIQFDEDKRVVELVGEAYFEVQGTKYRERREGTQTGRLPFIVKTQSQEIEVLGTQFNVWAHTDERVTKTTLAEGSLRVALAAGYSSSAVGHQPPATLKPGQQASSAGGNMNVQEVNVANEIAWKNGDFAFSNVPLIDIMKHLSRWYDVEIDSTQIPQTRYTVFISRQVNLSSVLRMLEKSGSFNFALSEANYIIITPKTEKLM